jgi:hypothetical protein
VVTNTDGHSGTLTAGYTYTTETVLLADEFNSGSLDTTKWSTNNLFSGFSDSAVSVKVSNQLLQIGPLFQNTAGSHYNGIRSISTYDFTGAYCYVELVQAASSSTMADSMLTIGTDVNNYYRIYVEAGNLIVQRKVAGTKTNMLQTNYNASSQKFLRIRHDSASGQVVFETAPDSSGSPGTWTIQYSELWNTSQVPLTALIFELKAGTWQAESAAPGTAQFDHFKAAKP